MQPSLSRSLLFASCLLAGPAFGQELPDILEQYPQTGTPYYLLVNISFTPDLCSSTGVFASPISDPELQQLGTNLEDELDLLSYGELTPIVHATNVTVPHSQWYYKRFGIDDGLVFIPPQTCPGYVSQMSPFAELRADVRAALQANPETPDPDDYHRVIYIGYQAFVGNGGQGTTNQRSLFVDLESLGVFPDEWHYYILHELGHSFLWQHAGFFKPGCVKFPGASGWEDEYGDEFDPMGRGDAGSTFQPRHRVRHWYNPWFMERAGWLPSSSVVDVTGPGEFDIQPIEDMPSSTPTALRIPLTDNTNAWVFWRRYAGGAHLEGAVVTLESESPISRALVLDANPEPGDPCKLKVWNAPVAYQQSLSIEMPGGGPTGITVINGGLQPGDKLRIEVTGTPHAQATTPVIGRIHDEPTTGDISGAFDYRFSAYLPSAGSTNGAGLTVVKMRLFEWTDIVRGAAFGIPGCAPACAGGPAGYGYPVPTLPCSPVTQLCGVSFPTQQVLPEKVFTSDQGFPSVFEWTVPTTELHNGLYWMFVEATGNNGTRTVIYWPHIIYNN